MLMDAFLTAKGIFFPFAIIIPIWYLTSYLTSPLRGFPGPFFAGLTNLWRMFYVYRGNYHKEIHRLHAKYGPVVRIAPNVLSLNFPGSIKIIYNTKENYRKTEFYHASSAKTKDGETVYNLFSQCDPKKHNEEQRPIGKYYKMANARSFEPRIDEVIDHLCCQWEKRFICPMKTFDLSEWLSLYAWDVIVKITFSESLGFLENGYDFNNTLKTSEKAMDYFSLVAQMPWLDNLLDKNPVCRIGPPSFGNITAFSAQRLYDRLEKTGANYSPNEPDFLDSFIQAKREHPKIVDDTQVISYLMINMIAGADTTAITLTAILYFSLKNPEVWKRLQDEIPIRSLNSGPGICSYNDSKGIPYLRAVVDESMRLHPAVAMPLERYVPEGGLILPNGQYIPRGCIIGMDPYTTGRNSLVWGRDPEVFRPERWLPDPHESENDYQERLRLMKKSDLTFGAGSRMCIGKNLALLQVYKIVATLVSRYDISLAHPDDDWTTHNSFFLRQQGVRVTICPRQK